MSFRVLLSALREVRESRAHDSVSVRSAVVA